MLERLIHLIIGTIAAPPPAPRDERGLSQSTENAILLAGAAVVALLIVGTVTTFVQGKLAALG